MSSRKFSVSGMTCSACSAHVEKAVSSVEGVKSVAVSLLTNSMSVEFESPATEQGICAAVSEAGYGATLEIKASEQKKTSGAIEDNETPKLLVRLIASALLLLPLMYVSMGYTMWGWWVPEFFGKYPIAVGVYQLLLTGIIMVINQRFFISGAKSAMHGAPNMDTLVALGSGAAFVYSTAVLFIMCKEPLQHHYLHELYFESSAMILTLITVGKTLESYSKGKTTNAIKSLMELAPKTAAVIRNGEETVIPAEQVVVGDVFVVRPGESIPVDGTVIEGKSAVDEAMLTGESIPADKSEGSHVSAATINKSGFLKCKAEKVGEDTALSRIIEMVENASSTKAPIAKIADRVSGYFVPVVIAIAVVTGVIWLLVGNSFGFALARSISVLVISCPCALGLATPVAIMVGSGIGAKNGILFKTASEMEAVGKTDIVILDKTGTITEGKPVVTDIITAEDISEDKLMSVAASLEEKSEHPLARAIMDKIAETDVEYRVADNFEALSGFGVRGVADGVTAIGGNAVFMRENKINSGELFSAGERFAEEGKTPLYFALGREMLGIIAVADIEKEDSAAAVEKLNRMGIQVVMLTGDNRRTAEAIGKRVGIDAVVSDVLPDDKEAVVRKLSEYGRVAMVGDGINDAPALTRADVGIAVGAGTDIAIEAADIVLMKSGLSDVPAAIRLSQRILRNIKENLFWAFVYNCIGIPLAAGALISSFGIQLNPMFAAAAMSLSSVCVVMNALRLNFCNIYSEKYDKKRKRVSLPELINNKTEVKGMTKTILIEGMMCAHCTAHVKKSLEAIDGVETAEVILDEKKAIVTLSQEIADKTLVDAVTEAGYEVTSCT